MTQIRFVIQIIHQLSIQLFNSQVLSNYIKHKFEKQEIKKRREEKFKIQEV
jgi:hypothetical protein